MGLQEARVTKLADVDGCGRLGDSDSARGVSGLSMTVDAGGINR